MEQDYKVLAVDYQAWTKRGAPKGHPQTLRVNYTTDKGIISEWVCPEHDGIMRQKFEWWWRIRDNTMPAPKNTLEALRQAKTGCLVVPEYIRTTQDYDDDFATVRGYIIFGTYLEFHWPPVDDYEDLTEHYEESRG
jgi:hypothetical protein